MNHHSLLPFVVLIVGIYAVARLRSTLAHHALFRPHTSSLWPIERLARGFQIAMITLLVIGTVSTAWNSPPDWHRLFPQRSLPQEPPHLAIPTETPPTVISPGDPLWLQREKRRDMQMWEAKTWQRYKRDN